MNEKQRYESSHKHEKQEKQLENILIKQGKQIRVLYELHKVTDEKVSWIQAQIKKQIKDQERIDLSPKVFGVSIFVFLSHLNNYSSLSISLTSIYYYTLIYRKGTMPYVLDIFQKRCGLALMNLDMVWKIGLKKTIRPI